MKPQQTAKYIDFAICALLFGLPVFAFPATADAFIASKYVFAKWMILILSSLFLIRFLWGGTIMILARPVNITLLAFFLWNCLTFLWAQSPSLALDHSAWMLYLVVLVFVLQDWFALRRNRVIYCAWALIAAGAVIAIITLIQDFGIVFFPDSLPDFLHIRAPKLPDWRGYLSATFGNTSHIADFLALQFIPALMLYFLRSKNLAKNPALVTINAQRRRHDCLLERPLKLGLILAALVFVAAIFLRHGTKFFRSNFNHCLP